MGRKFVLGLDLGTSLGVARVFTEEEIDAQTVRLEANIGSRAVGVAGIVKHFAGPVCIEGQLSGRFSSVKALFPMPEAAILACELEGLPWSAGISLDLNIHATGKGDAKEPEMQAAAKARWNVSLKGDEADA